MATKKDTRLIALACKRLEVGVKSLLASSVDEARGVVTVITEDHRKHVFKIEELSAKTVLPKAEAPTVARAGKPPEMTQLVMPPPDAV